ncbi:ribosomal RNA processing protein 36 homolog [Varroa jacobsoni]|uniref:ribosomal RNA processing protein 36 homolog n=1 Tax=Varroa jacobsoni TaxID=62625 RepID=UPI000BF86EBA|nr:ribosomal RNA processing protein 36 homolog [Varroa jacobsoni]
MADGESSDLSHSDYIDSDSELEAGLGDPKKFSDDEVSSEHDKNLSSDLKGQSFEEILALKDCLGLRTYKTAIGLRELDQKKRKKVFKRENKNRPREISSKNPVTGVKNIFNVKKKLCADPRFERGFEEVQPRNAIKAEHKVKQKLRDYAFIDKIRENEVRQIERSLAEGQLDDAEAFNARKILQKAKSREVSRHQEAMRKEMNDRYTKFLKDARNAGEKIRYMTKKDKKQVELAIKFNELKKSGKLEKYLEKKRKKNAARSRKKMHNKPV